MDIILPFDALAPYDVLMLRYLFYTSESFWCKEIMSSIYGFWGGGVTWGAWPILTQGKNPKANTYNVYNY